jgi:hypothetical protein
MSPIKCSIQKHGHENFTIEQIDSALTIEELNIKEQYWISFYNSMNRNTGYNLMSGGGSTGKHGPDTIRKMREAKIGKSTGPRSDEVKKKLSEMRKGKPSPHKGKKGRANTPEQKLATSLRFKGKPTHNRFKGKNPEMYAIKKKLNRYFVTVTKQYLGCFKTLIEAQKIRDEFVKNIIAKELDNIQQEGI